MANYMLPVTNGLAGVRFSVIWSVVGLIEYYVLCGVSPESGQIFLIFWRSFFAVLAALGFD